MRYFLIWLLAILPLGAAANEPPPVPEGGFYVMGTYDCIDPETGAEGTCHVLQAVKDGEVYVAFWQGETLMMIRHVIGDTYETIWVNDLFNAV
jgi:hypothetical protein